MFSRDAKYTDMASKPSPPCICHICRVSKARDFYRAHIRERRSSGPPQFASGARCGQQSAVVRRNTQSQQADDSLTQERLFATLSSFFCVLALLLACIGLYGVMSYYGVARRTHEIGIRMALGASAPRVTRMVMRETMVLF